MQKLLTPITAFNTARSEDFVAAGLYVDEGESSHAAIIICHNKKFRVFHFYKSVLLEAPQNAIDEGLIVFIKRLDFIPSKLVSSFVAHCEIIEKEAKPKFGFFYNAKSFYDENGSFQNPGQFPEYLTCVGFCLCVLQTYTVNTEFLYTQDWNHTSLDIMIERTAYQMLEIKRNYPDITEEQLERAVRRILPIEYFSGAYAGGLPVRKSFTDIFSEKLKLEMESID